MTKIKAIRRISDKQWMQPEISAQHWIMEESSFPVEVEEKVWQSLSCHLDEIDWILYELVEVEDKP